MPSLNGGALRRLRKQRKLSQVNLGDRIKMSQGGISTLEKNGGEIEAELLKSISEALCCPERELIVQTQSDRRNSLAEIHATLLRTIDDGVRTYGRFQRDPLHLSDVGSTATAEPLRYVDNQDGTRKSFNAALSRYLRQNIAKRRGRSTEDGLRLLAVTGTDGGLLEGRQDDSQFSGTLKLLDDLVSCGGRIEHVVRISTTLRDNLEARGLIEMPPFINSLRIALRYHHLHYESMRASYEKLVNRLRGLDEEFERSGPLRPSTFLVPSDTASSLPIYQWYFLEQDGPVEFDVDLYELQGYAHAILFPGSGKVGWEYGQVSEGESKAIPRFAAMLRSYSRVPVVVFGPNPIDSLRFAREWSRSPKGSYFLVQDFPGEITRPVHHYQPGTAWWRRVAKHYSNSVEPLAKLRRSRYHQIHDELNRINPPSVQQICSLKEIEAWRHSGKRSDVDPNFGGEDRREERLERARFIVELLERHSSFEVILDEERRRDRLSWSVLDGTRCNVERSLLDTDSYWQTCSEGSHEGDKKIRVVIENSIVGRLFEQVFVWRWCKLIGADDSMGEAQKKLVRDRNRRDVLAYFRQVVDDLTASR